MNVLYYSEPITGFMGGVNNVAYNLPKALAKKIQVAYFPKFVPNPNYLSNMLKIYSNFALGKFNIIHFNLLPAVNNGSFLLLRASKKLGVPSILNIHGYLPIEETFPEFQHYTAAIAKVACSNTIKYCKMMDKIVVNSAFMCALVTTGYQLQAKNIAVIPNGINLEKFECCKEKLALQGDPVILFLGQLSTLKGLDVLIEAAPLLQRELPQMKIHVAGHGNKNEFQRLANKLGVNQKIVFHGAIPYSDIPRWYKSADICVFPSRHEGFGITVLEAMASKKPVIVSDIAAYREMVFDGKNGLLFKSGNAQELAKVVCKLYDNLKLRQTLARNAFETAKRYSWDSVAAKYISLYESLSTKH
jgi:glycosyltransferase involved in cell wall biosynthesis